MFAFLQKIHCLFIRLLCKMSSMPILSGENPGCNQVLPPATDMGAAQNLKKGKNILNF